jgi:hypothetical protein
MRLGKRRTSGGFAFIVLLAFMTVGALYFFVSQLDAAAIERKRDETTALALAEAKEALIGWSAANDSAPGRLPCPEDTSLIGTPNEGRAQSNCNAFPAIGRLPWKTLGLSQLRDGHGEPLWYVLSPGFRALPINSNTPPQLTVDGAPGSAVAIILAPGPALPGQTRTAITAATPPSVATYLDLTNADGSATFVTNGPPAAFNDRLLTISHRDLFTAVERRVAGEVVEALLTYFCGDSDNVNRANQTCLGPGGARLFPRPAAFGDTTCLGSSAIADPKCGSAPAGNEGRIPANPADPWTHYNLSLLRGTIGTDNWFQRNGWRELAYFAVSDRCMGPGLDCSEAGNLLTVDGAASARAVVIVGGAAVASQLRAPPPAAQVVASNYLEADNATMGDNSYVSRAPLPFNDQLRAIR